MNTRQQGDLGVAYAIWHYTKKGYIVSIPNTEASRYDLVVDDGERLLRVQCKTTSYRTPEGVFQAQLRTSGGNSSWTGVVKKISRAECDLVFILTEDVDAYEFPSEFLDGRTTVNLGKKAERFRV